MRAISYLPITFFKNVSFSIASSLATRMLSCIATPIALSYLDPTSFGTWSLLSSISTCATIIFGLGLRQAYMLCYPHCTEQEQWHLTCDIMTLYTLWVTALGSILFASRAWWSKIISPTIPSHFIYCILLSSLLFFFTELFFQHLKNRQEILRLSMFQIISGTLPLFGNLFFLRTMRLDIAGLIITQLITSTLITIIALNSFLPHFQLNLVRSCRRIKELAPLSLPFIPTIFCSWLISSSDRWFLAHYATMHDVGLYAVADLITLAFNALILVPLGTCYVPYMLNTYAQNTEAVHHMEKRNKTLMWLCIFSLTILSLLAFWIIRPFFFKFIPMHHHAAFTYMPLLTLGQIFLCGTYFSTLLMQFHKKSYILSASYAVPAFANILLNYLLVPRYHIMGAALATALSYALYFIVTLSYNKRLKE